MEVYMEKFVFGYARISTDHQELQSQINELINAGVTQENIFMDKMTGATIDRPQYKALMERIKTIRQANPTIPIELYIYNLDRLSRDFETLKEQYQLITGTYNCQLHVIKLPILNKVYSDNLTTKLIHSIIIDLLSWVAETEKAFLHTRQESGIQAKRRGLSTKGKKDMGSPTITPDTFKNWSEVYNNWKTGKITATQARNELRYFSNGEWRNISRSKLYELDKQIQGLSVEYPQEWKDQYYTDWKAGKIRSVITDTGKRVIAYAELKEGKLEVGEVIQIPQGKFYKLCKQYESEQK